jgi:arylsulfatase A-like enzyme
MASLMRGVYPLQLSWEDVRKSRAWQISMRRYPNREYSWRWYCIPEVNRSTAPTIAERLRRRGMRTVAIPNDHEGFSMERQFMGSGFEEYFDDVTGGDAEVVARLPALLQRLTSSERPFFLWVHLWAAHALDMADAANPGGYDPALRRADALLGEALGTLERVGPDKLAIFVTSDHGEGFDGTHRSHGLGLSDEELRVPLLLRVPGVRPKRSSALVSHVDIVPTILELTNTPGDDALPGRSLLGPLGGPRVLHADVWSRLHGFAHHAAFDGRLKVQYGRPLRQWSVFDSTAGDRLLVDTPEPARLLRAALEDYLRRNEAHLQF